MKAIVLKLPKKLELKDVPDPILGEYEVLCSIEASAICSGTDHEIFCNHNRFKVKLPAIIGHEAVGLVVARGSKVKYFKPGDLISRINNHLPEGCGIDLVWGGMAEFGTAVDWRAMKEDGCKEDLWKKFTANRVLPKNFDPIASTMIITWRETLAFLKRLNFVAGDNVVIIGSGAVALSFVCHLHNLKIRTVIIGNPGRRDKFLSCGAEAFISYKEKDWNNILKSLVVFGVRGVIDACGDYRMLNKLVTTLKAGSRVGLYGLNKEKDQAFFTPGVRSGICFFDGLDYDEGSVHEEVIEGVLSGRLKAETFIDSSSVYSMDNYQQAYKDAWSGKNIKSIITFRK